MGAAGKGEQSRVRPVKSSAQFTLQKPSNCLSFLPPGAGESALVGGMVRDAFGKGVAVPLRVSNGPAKKLKKTSCLPI